LYSLPATNDVEGEDLVEKNMKPISSLSNSSYSSGQGIPKEVSGNSLSSDFLESFFKEKKNEDKETTQFHHEPVDIYSTVVG
jgi:hypothetical protein